jgi:hypothetical protein
MKKHSFFFVFFFLVLQTLSSQRRILHQLPNFDKKKYHWGFYLGLNSRDFKVAYQKSDFKNTHVSFANETGFNVGLIGDMRILDNLNVRLEPGLWSNTSTIYFRDQNFIDGTIATTDFAYENAEISSTYFHFPILLKWSTNRLNNIRPYVIGGVSYDLNFSSKQKNKDDNRTNVFRMRTHNLMYEVGMGIDIYFPYFKFSPSIRGQFAITNELFGDNKDATQPTSPYTDPIDFLGTSAVFLKFAFE